MMVPSLISVLLAAFACGTGSAERSPALRPTVEDYTNLLETSKDPDDLAEALVGLSQLASPAAWEVWEKHLQDANFWRRFEPDSKAPALERLERVARVLTAAARRNQERATQALLTVCKSKHIADDSWRASGFWDACEHIREPSRGLLDFIESHAEPEASSGHIVYSLVRMRAPLAYDRLEKLYLSGIYDAEDRADWFVRYFLLARNDPNMIALYKRLLFRAMNDEGLERPRYDGGEWNCHKTTLKNILLHSIFGNDLTWCIGGEPDPPPRCLATTKALEELLVIADLSRKLNVSEETRTGVAKGRKEIEEILAFRRSGGPERIAQFIAEMVDARYAVRENATKKLAQFGNDAGPAIRKALRGPLSTEARRRLEVLAARLVDRKTEERIQKYIAQLDDQDVLQRFRAYRHLSESGEVAGPAIWNALQRCRSPRLQERMEELLEELDR